MTQLERFSVELEKEPAGFEFCDLILRTVSGENCKNFAVHCEIPGTTSTLVASHKSSIGAYGEHVVAISNLGALDAETGLYLAHKESDQLKLTLNLDTSFLHNQRDAVHLSHVTYTSRYFIPSISYLVETLDLLIDRYNFIYEQDKLGSVRYP